MDNNQHRTAFMAFLLAGLLVSLASLAMHIFGGVLRDFDASKDGIMFQENSRVVLAIGIVLLGISLIFWLSRSWRR